MLPTHIVRIQEPGDSESRGEDGMVYPPQQSSVRHRTTYDKNTRTSLQSTLFGKRGVTSLTIQAQTPYSGKDEGDRRLEKDSYVDIASKRGASPSRWNTLEFYFYAFVFATVVPWMCWVPISLSQGEKKIEVHLGKRKTADLNSPQNQAEITCIIPHTSKLVGCLAGRG
jgi:hypothetical protein